MDYKTSLWRRCQLYWIGPMYKLEKSDWEKVDVKKAESWDREKEKKKKKPIKALKLKQKEMAFEVKSAQLQRTVERERERERDEIIGMWCNYSIYKQSIWMPVQNLGSRVRSLVWEVHFQLQDIVFNRYLLYLFICARTKQNIQWQMV